MATVLVGPASPAAGPQPDPEGDGPSPRPGLRERLGPPMPGDRLWGWLGPLAVAVLAGFLRFDRLAKPPGKIFDEVYYAKDAYDLLRYGVERNTEGTGPGFVVHPPLGKWAIALGQAAFGNDEFGWRFSAAVAGTVSVFVLARVARRMTRSTLLGCLAGLLLALDGLHLVQSRIAMLDIFLLMWLVLAFGCLVVDRDVVRDRLAAAVDRGSGVARPGPRLGVRWWLLGAGACLGAALATKWSAVYFVVVFGLLALSWEIGARRTAGVGRPVRSGIRRGWLPVGAAVGLVPLLVYTLSWTGWFLSDDGWDRQWAQEQGRTGGVARSWVHYHAAVLRFHANLESRHPYQSDPGTWLALARPVAYYYTAQKDGELDCRTPPPGCSREVLGVGTPAIWWASAAGLVAMLWLWVSRRDWRAAGILAGAGAGLLPWFATLDRTMFLFYALPALPFLVLGITVAAGAALGRPGASPLRRRWGAIGVGAYVLLVVTNLFGVPFVPAFGLLPILTARTIPFVDWDAKTWFSSWV